MVSFLAQVILLLTGPTPHVDQIGTAYTLPCSLSCVAVAKPMYCQSAASGRSDKPTDRLIVVQIAVRLQRS